MNDPAPALDGAIDFKEVIDTALQGYFERPAVEAEVREYLLAHPSGCCLLTGEPGSGKSSLAAALIRADGYLHHFLRREHTQFALWRDPYAFLAAVGFQLRDRYGDALFPETVALDVQGNVRDVGEGASVVGAEIAQLVAIPWHSAALKVTLRAEGVRGKVAGVRIERVVEDYRAIPLPAFLSMALLDPLRRLRRLHPDERVVLWVDGLDEETDAVATGTPGIASILPGPDELRELRNLALVISSRPTPLLDRFAVAGAHAVPLDASRFEQDTADLVERYIDRELVDDRVRARIAEAKRDANQIRAEIIAACSGNLLYLRHFFVALREDGAESLLAGGLPQGLDSIYVRLLERLAMAAGPRFPSDHYPLLRCLAVAARPLTTAQLQEHVALDAVRVKAARADLRPFLDVVPGEKSDTYRLYHTSFRECLVAPRHAHALWHVDASTAHASMASHYLARADRVGWERLDDYGLDFIVHHLANADEPLRPRLIDVLGQPLRRAQRRRHGSNAKFAADLGIAAAALWRTDGRAPLVETARLALMATLVAEVEGQIAPAAVTLMVRLGGLQRALGAIHSGLDTSRAIQLYAGVVRGLTLAGETAKPLMCHVLSEALERLAAEPDHLDLSTLLEACSADPDPAMDRLIRRATEVFNAAPGHWATPRALTELARLLSMVDVESARQAYRQVFDLIPRFTSTSSTLAYARLFPVWAQFDVGEAAAALNGIQLRPDANSVEAVLSVGRALAAAGSPESLVDLHRQIRDMILPGVLDPFEAALAHSALAEVEVELAEVARARESIQAALLAAESMGGATDPEARLYNRPEQRTTALVRIAEVGLRVDSAWGDRVLQQAWTSLGAARYFEAGYETIDTIVQEQLRRDPDLLEAQIAAIPDQELRARLLLAHGAALLPADVDGAKARLEEALLLSETPRSQGRASVVLQVGGEAQLVGASPELAIAAARVLVQSDRTAAEALVDGIGDADVVVEWRLGVLEQLLAKRDPVAGPWWRGTFRRWVDGCSNPNFLIELPAFLRALPQSLLTELAEQVGTVPDPSKRRLLQVALSARQAVADPEKGVALLREALTDLGGGSNDGLLPDYRVLAFAAGQWRGVDSEVADACWLDSLFRIETLAGTDGPGSGDELRRFPLERAIEDLSRGAPSSAIAALLPMGEARVSPNSIQLVVPGAGVPVPLAGGMTARDYLLGSLVGREAAHPGVGRTHVVLLSRPAARALAASEAARRATDIDLVTRLRWCDVAEQASRGVEEHHLSCLLLAYTAVARREVGARTKASELARATATDILARGGAFGAVHREPAYAHAFGTCIRLLAEDENRCEEAARLVWDGRRLGRGLRLALAALAPGLARYSDELNRLCAIEQEADALFG